MVRYKRHQTSLYLNYKYKIKGLHKLKNKKSRVKREDNCNLQSQLNKLLFLVSQILNIST
jgi:hypothetical protein